MSRIPYSRVSPCVSLHLSHSYVTVVRTRVNHVVNHHEYGTRIGHTACHAYMSHSYVTKWNMGKATTKAKRKAGIR
eukprot:389443-Amorphochlora_amoeboformis.AAC.1